MHRTLLALAALPVLAACAQMDTRPCENVAAERAALSASASGISAYQRGKLAGLEARLAECRKD